MKRLLRQIKRISDKIFGTIIDELYWRFRHFLDKNWAKRYLADSAINNPHRQILIETIARYSPLKSVLEIGCASGPNLYLLAKKSPAAQLYGIDISKKAIIFGANWLNGKKIKNVTLSYGKADNLNSFSDKSIGVIFTDATLIYIGPDKIDKVIEEMIRVARKAIILIEWNSEKEQSYEFDHWAYNWKTLFEKRGETNISLTKLKSRDPEGGWKELGCLVELVLKS